MFKVWKSSENVFQGEWGITITYYLLDLGAIWSDELDSLKQLLKKREKRIAVNLNFLKIAWKIMRINKKYILGYGIATNLNPA